MSSDLNREKTTNQMQELYPENSDAATKRSLEGLANAIGNFRAAVHHIADQETSTRITTQQLEQASKQKRSAQRRVMLEWATAMVLCVTMLVPALGYLRDRNVRMQAQQHEQLMKQRQADEALLEQVSHEVSEAVPDSMQPLAELDADYAGNQIQAKETETRNGNK